MSSRGPSWQLGLKLSIFPHLNDNRHKLKMFRLKWLQTSKGGKASGVFPSLLSPGLRKLEPHENNEPCHFISMKSLWGTNKQQNRILRAIEIKALWKQHFFSAFFCSPVTHKYKLAIPPPILPFLKKPNDLAVSSKCKSCYGATNGRTVWDQRQRGNGGGTVSSLDCRCQNRHKNAPLVTDSVASAWSKMTL